MSGYYVLICCNCGCQWILPQGFRNPEFIIMNHFQIGSMRFDLNHKWNVVVLVLFPTAGASNNESMSFQKIKLCALC
jgi:hypothetical protein